LIVGSLLAGLVGAGCVAAALLLGAPAPGADVAPAVAPVALAEPVAAEAGPSTAAAEPAGRPALDPGWLAETAARTGIAPRALEAYASAAHRIAREQPACGLGWNTLAGIGFVESEHGTIFGGALEGSGAASPQIIGIPLDGVSTKAVADTDDGRLDRDPVWDRAVGPMQFIPSTWAEWGGDGNGDGIADPQNIDDAAYSAARYLCAAGGDLTDPDRWIAAVAAYNDTIEYNHRVAEAAEHYASSSAG
jgi:membrane-bound lytic murein transglycosylase B